MKKKREITLLALVIIIVTILTLFGLTLRLTLGENGKLKFSKSKLEKYMEEQNKEIDELNKYIEETELPENSKKYPQVAGTIVKQNPDWKMPLINVKTENELLVTEILQNSTVYAVSVENGETIPVPKGFYYVGGTLSSGVVISDNSKDYNKYAGIKDVPAGVIYDEDGIVLTYTEEDYKKLSEEDQKKILLGNQFVWIPVDNQTISKVKTNCIELACIQKYGGFYVGRYEAGTSQIVFSNEACLQNPTETDNNMTNLEYLSNLVLEGEITQKAGEIPYYYADLNTAVEMSEKMYESCYVQSELITENGWNMVMNFIGTKDNCKDMKNTLWENYNETSFVGRYINVDKETKKTIDAFKVSDDEKHYGIRTTASTEKSKKNNIYDIDSNLWEWTKATYNEASNLPMVYYGFRPVLYMK